MPKFVARRINRDTVGRAVVEIEAIGFAGGMVHGDAQVLVEASSQAGAAVLGDAELLNDENVFAAGAIVVGDAEVIIEATGRAGEKNTSGFPYTFPITFGGKLPIEGETVGSAEVVIEASGEAGAIVIGDRDVPIVSVGITDDVQQGGFPYKFPIHFGGGTTPPNTRFPYTFPFKLK